MSIRCKLGIHDWKITREESGVCKIMVQVEAQRTCQRCGKMQEQDTHCLGLNPPEYIKSWHNIEPPKFEKPKRDKRQPKKPLFNDTLLFKQVACSVGKVEALNELLAVSRFCKFMGLPFVIDHPLHLAFNWNNTPQGYDYWRQVSKGVDTSYWLEWDL